MNHTIKITMQSSDTTLPKGKRDILAFPSPMLVPCAVTEHTDDFEIEFDTTGLVSCNETRATSLQDKFRLLHNCARLERLTTEFSFSLAPDNVCADVNLLPRVLKRDVGRMDKADFLAQYKALVAAVLAPKHSFEDYYNGGADLYRKSKQLKSICKQQTVQAVANVLLERYHEETATNRERKTIVGKGRFLFYRIALPALAVVSTGCVALAVYLGCFRLPLAEQLIRGNSAYLSSEYLAVQDELSGIAVDKLPAESKYILARSYVVTESLNSSQKENILTMLTTQTDPLYFDYWIELGRLRFEGAIDTAQRIGDDQLLLLAYIKYESFLETDTRTLTGDEKAQKIRDLKDKIKALSSNLETSRTEATTQTDAAADSSTESASAGTAQLQE